MSKLWDKLNYIIRRISHSRYIDMRYFHNIWEEEHLYKLLVRLKADCVFDVGANYGQYASMLRSKIGFNGLIISFEPIPEAAAALREQSASDDKWIIQEEAISTFDGEQIFNIMSSSQFSSLSEPRHDEVDLFKKSNLVERSISVNSETLNTAYKRLKNKYNFQRPFLKMDTQGFDVEIVKYSRDVMKEFIGLQSELAIKKIYDSSIDFREAISIYEECGFSLSAFVPNNAGHFPRLIETDCIMVRNDLMSNKA